MPEADYLGALRAHTNGRSLELPASAAELRRDLRTALVQGRQARKIVTSMEQITRQVTILKEDQVRTDFGKLFKELHARDLHRGAFCIFGGVKNQGRDASLPHFERSDGGWFDFSITVREARGGLELLAYDFEMRFAPGMGAPFIRFDMNLPDHRNDQRDLRCHLHPGSDDVLVPAPMMSPSEVLAFFIDGARLPADRKPRSPTDFEVGWLRQSLQRASPPGTSS